MREVLRAATPEDFPQLWALLEACFGEGTGPGFEAIITHDPWFDPENTRILTVDGRLASHVQVHRRPVRFGLAQVALGGIGHVGTHPDFRKHGYSTRVLNDCIRLMERKGYELSLLFTGINDFYSKDGWCTLQTTRFAVPPESVPDWEDDGIVVRHYAGDEDMAERSVIYESESREWLGSLCRNETYWRRQPRWASLEGADEDPLHSLMAEVDGRAVAYASFRPKSGCAVLELAALPGNDLAAKALIAALAHKTRQLQGDRLRLDMPVGSRPHRLLCEAGVTVEESTARHYMVRVNDLAGLLNALAPEFAVRLQEVGLADATERFVLDIGLHRAAVEVDGARVHAYPTTSQPDITVEQASFIAALHGYDSGRAALRAEAGPWTDLVSAMFPAGIHVYAPGDHF